jgi:AraC family transcriptional regulator of adaptative response / DNA-3-methyladenine glycosylase II
LIEGGALDVTGGVEALANRLGVGSRHLSRLFAEHLGASPIEVAKTLRVQRAKRLLTDSDLTMNDVARRAGFRSARRMNAAFACLYGRPPSSFRRRRAVKPSPDLS